MMHPLPAPLLGNPSAAIKRRLGAAWVTAGLAIVAPWAAGAASFQIEIDPGVPGETFAERVLEIPELVGESLSTEEFELRFRFPGSEFMITTLYGGFSALRAVSLELSVTPGLPNQAPSAGGFLMNEQGGALEPTVTVSDGGLDAAAGEFRRSLHVPRPVRLPPSITAVESDPYFGLFYSFQFLIVPPELDAEILSARIRFEDERGRFPIAADPQHTVGALVPTPPAAGLLVLGLGALLGLRRAAG